MNRISSTLERRTQRGVTLMEVIFAIGVILTGLVGLAALIPVAANNAKTTLELDRSISESTSSAATGAVRSFNDANELVIFDKATAGSTANATGSYGYLPSEGMRTIGWKLDRQSNYDPPINATTGFEIFVGKLETPGYGHMPLGSGLSAGVCIDPLGMPDPYFASPFTAVETTDSAYDNSRFPYYGERYNVLNPPNEAVGSPAGPGGPTGTTPSWPMSPRMWRATLKTPLYDPPLRSPPLRELPLVRRDLIPATAVGSIFLGSGGLSPFAPKGTDDPRSVLLSQTVINGELIDSARDVSSEYSWFVTLTPPFLGGDTFRQAIVVVRQRQAPVPKFNQDPLALKRTSYTITDTEENPPAERVTWIEAANGFIGGAGGEVLIYGSQSVDDDIQAGQWVMLSRQPHELSATGVPSVPIGPAVHRWYRVLRTDEPEVINGYASPLGTQNVWRRWVSLAGPDWAFQDETTNTTGIDDTFCTIVTGAVSVVESEVVVQ